MPDNELEALGVSAERNEDSYRFDEPDPTVLERFEAPYTLVGEGTCREKIEIECPEFTSLCPVTGQPDFADITIRYIPDDWCVESKSLKLYLMGYRNYGAFHEACINLIGTHLDALLVPRELHVLGNFYPRGGISINPEFCLERNTRTWTETRYHGSADNAETDA